MGAWKTVKLRAMQTVEASFQRFQRGATSAAGLESILAIF